MPSSTPRASGRRCPCCPPVGERRGEGLLSLSPLSLQSGFLLLPAALQSAPAPQAAGHTWPPGETRPPAGGCCPAAAPGGSWAAAQWQDAPSCCPLRNPTTKIKVRGLSVDKHLRRGNKSPCLLSQDKVKEREVKSTACLCQELSPSSGPSL